MEADIEVKACLCGEKKKGFNSHQLNCNFNMANYERDRQWERETEARTERRLGKLQFYNLREAYILKRNYGKACILKRDRVGKNRIRLARLDYLQFRM